jgi:hypothetical protein
MIKNFKLNIFLNRLKYTNTYSKYTIRVFLPLLKLKKRKDFKYASSIQDVIKNFENLTVLGSGPSLNKCNFNTTDLYITTNSSYLSLSNKHSFIHVIRDGGYLKQFLMFGLKYKPQLLIVEALYTEKAPLSHIANYGVLALKNYLGKRKFDYPILITGGKPFTYFNFNNSYIKKNEFLKANALDWHDSNSGITIYSYAVWWANMYHHIKRVDVYGIDAGQGGEVYFDGQKTKSDHVAMKDLNKSKMAIFFTNCQTKYKFIQNYSYFKNNVD